MHTFAGGRVRDVFVDGEKHAKRFCDKGRYRGTIQDNELNTYVGQHGAVDWLDTR